MQQDIKTGEVVLIGIGIATILVNIGIWHTYSGQLEQMRIATEASTRAANLASDSFDAVYGEKGIAERTMDQTIHQTAAQIQSAAAAENGVAATRDQMRLDQRAWVEPYAVCPMFKNSPISIANHDECNPAPQGAIPAQAAVLFKNFGKTPAMKLHVWIDWREKEDEIPEFDSDPTPDNQLPRFNLGPNVFSNTGTHLPQNIVDNINGDISGEFVYGTIWYNDVFHRHHWTQFCFEIEPHFGAFGGCKSHTETDDTYKRTAPKR
ncbi:MAG: hypothetical protein ACLPY1_15245 [Terracidiphilus sp.]